MCARAVALLSHYEQQSEIPPPGLEQLFSRCDHGRNDALGVAGAASPDVSSSSREGINGGTVSICVESTRLVPRSGRTRCPGPAQRPSARSGRRIAARVPDSMPREVTDFSLVWSDRFDIDQSSCELEHLHGSFLLVGSDPKYSPGNAVTGWRCAREVQKERRKGNL